MRACHHVAIVIWGTVRGVPSIISLPSPVKAAFSPLMTVLFLNLNLCKSPQKKKKKIMNWSIQKGESWYTSYKAPSNTSEPFWWAMKGQKFYKHMDGKRVVFRTVETHVDRARAVCLNDNSLGSGQQSGRHLQSSVFTNNKFFLFLF